MTDHIDATQEDREAAKAWVNRPRGHSYEQTDALEAFTRHRLASERALIDFLTELDGQGVPLAAAVAIWENRT